MPSDPRPLLFPPLPTLAPDFIVRPGSVPVANQGDPILPANPERWALLIWNGGLGGCGITFGTAPSAGTGMALPANNQALQFPYAWFGPMVGLSVSVMNIQQATTVDWIEIIYRPQR